MKGLAGQLVKALKAQAVPAIEVEVFAGKILADSTNEMGLCEKARGDGSVTGGAAQETGVFRVRRFDGIEGGGADY